LTGAKPQTYLLRDVDQPAAYIALPRLDDDPSDLFEVRPLSGVAFPVELELASPELRV
jgi:hypothetical protein